MPVLAGLDSFAQPTRAQAEELWAQGFRWWGFNIGGASAADIWALSTVNMLRELGYELLPIWVPALSMSGNAQADAQAAMAAARTYGCDGVIAVDTEQQTTGNPRLRPYLDIFEATVKAESWRLDVYAGAHYVPAGAVEWLPSWVPRPTDNAPGEGAQQWAGNAADAGMEVDENLAAPGFPLDNAPQQPPPASPFVPVAAPPPVLVQQLTDKELGAMQTVLVSVSLDATGNGQEPTNFPASSFIGISKQCADSDPGVDNNYWYGEVAWQPRNNMILVAVTRAGQRSGGAPKTAGVYLTLAN